MFDRKTIKLNTKDDSKLNLIAELFQLENNKSEYKLHLYIKKSMIKKEEIAHLQFQVINNDPAFSELCITEAIKIWNFFVERQFRRNGIGVKMIELLCDYINDITNFPHTIIAYPGGELPPEILYKFYERAGFKPVDKHKIVYKNGAHAMYLQA